jgi:hypothetical protein
MIKKDDRTPEQMQTHRVLIVATDRCLSSWGGAEGGSSYAAWACTGMDSFKVESWVRARSDMKRVRVTFDDGAGAPYRPGKGCAHLHIYVVTEGHPALS